VPAAGWAAATVELVAKAFPPGSDEVANWPACERLLPHALAAADHAEAHTAAPERTGWLLNRAAAYLWARARFREAQACSQRALAIAEATLGPDHPTIATARNNLGGDLRALGDLAGAKAQLERAVAIDEAAYGPDHPEIGTDRSNLGGVLRAMGDLAGAKAQYERALAIAEAALGPDHPTTGAIRDSLDTLR
jgi:tetratricopeptide (TPR) repeat protein